MTGTNDVVIVGAGPTGATLALVLATQGIKVHVVTRANWLSDSPRAHITNQRTMEVFRDLGIEGEILRHATAWDQMGDTPFATSLAGEELVRLRTWGTGDRHNGAYRRASPCGLVDLIQPILEPILVKAAAERGASFAFNTEYREHRQDTDGVTVELHDHVADQNHTLRARYLFGADGARSRIVEQLGLPFEGEMARAGTVYTQFEADLGHIMRHRPSILNWIVSPEASFGEIGMGLLRAVKPWTHWIAGWGFDLTTGPNLDPELIRARIGTLIGDPTISVTIQRTSVWYVNQAYATRYQAGRVLCGGDAVHRHPPSSGLGMNTCVQDAYNLGWKLAMVLKGEASPALLDSYSDERAPVGKQIVLRANKSRLDYAPLNACFRVAGVDNPVAAGIARFRESGSDGVAARRAVEAALALKDSEFNALGVELNQFYRSGAVLDDADTPSEPFVGDLELDLHATTRPGAKIPHVWLVDARGQRRSTLDVVGGGRFTLVTGLAGQSWIEAAAAIARPFLRTIAIGASEFQDLYCDWQRVREIAEDGALLVRPDGHIAWRATISGGDAATCARILSEVLVRLLWPAATDLDDQAIDLASRVTNDYLVHK